MAAPAVVPIRKPLVRTAQTAQRERELRYKRSIDRRAVLLDRLEARVKAITAEQKALAQRKELALSRFEKLEESLLVEMAGLNANTLTGMDRVLRSKPNPPRLVVLDESKIPAQYMRQPPIPAKEPDKVQLKALLVRASADEPAASDTQEAAQLAGAVKLVQTVSLVRK